MTTPVAVCGCAAPLQTPADEAELVISLKAGDEAAYETLFRTHAGAMLAVARRFFGDTDDSADAVQDAFVSAFRAMGTFAESARLGTWLHRITVNACLMKLRSRKRRPNVSLDDRVIPARIEEAEVHRAETCRRVRTAVSRLPDAYRVVVQLRDFDGLDTAATAVRLGTSAEVVKTRLHRARHALKALLETEQAALTN
jgi:RNA polymerase sigma-70 factor (ECF subfamily)